MNTPRIFLVTLLTTISYASPNQCHFNPASYAFEFANLTGVILSDGPIQLNVNLLLSAPTQAVLRAYSKNFRRAEFPMFLPQIVAVIDSPAGRIMFDTGSSSVRRDNPLLSKAGKLMRTLRSAGIHPNSIDAVVLTHGHQDHVGGLTKRDGSAAFPNARVFIGREEHEFWAENPLPYPNPLVPSDIIRSIVNAYASNIKPYQEKGRFHLVEKNGEILPGFRYIYGPGHSPGHSAVEITSNGEQMIICGDTWISKPDQVQNPEWSFYIESNSTQAYLSRVRLLSRAAESRSLVLAYHEDFPGLGYVSKVGQSFDWTSAPLQLVSFDFVPGSKFCKNIKQQ